MYRFIAPLLLVSFLAFLVAGCSGMSDEEIAHQVAEDWTTSSIRHVTEDVMSYLTGNAPIVSQIAGGALVDEIADRVTWTYGTPRCSSDGDCTITATAKSEVDINIPFVMDETVTITLPFNLEIDTNDEEVAFSQPDFSSASIAGIDFGGAGDSIRNLGSQSEEIIRQGEGGLQQAEDALRQVEKNRGAVENAGESIQNLLKR